MTGMHAGDPLEQFRCPLSKQVMLDPVKLCDGIYYEREAITGYIDTCLGESDDIRTVESPVMQGLFLVCPHPWTDEAFTKQCKEAWAALQARTPRTTQRRVKQKAVLTPTRIHRITPGYLRSLRQPC